MVIILLVSLLYFLLVDVLYECLLGVFEMKMIFDLDIQQIQQNVISRTSSGREIQQHEIQFGQQVSNVVTLHTSVIQMTEAIKCTGSSRNFKILIDKPKNLSARYDFAELRHLNMQDINSIQQIIFCLLYTSDAADE